MSDYSVLDRVFSEKQAEWLAPARSRLLRRADIARRKTILELGCGHGVVTRELLRRSVGRVVALDRSLKVFLNNGLAGFSSAGCICANAERLPFADQSFDLIFSQFSMLWFDISKAAAEIARVLQPGGVLAAIEPDYGGMIEYPPEIATRDIWLAALEQAGADPYVGRKLPETLAASGLNVQVALLEELVKPSPLRFDILAELPLNEKQRTQLEAIRQADHQLTNCWPIAHLPVFLILAEKNANY